MFGSYEYMKFLKWVWVSIISRTYLALKLFSMDFTEKVFDQVTFLLLLCNVILCLLSSKKVSIIFDR